MSLPTIVQAQRLPIKTYTTADGLARNHVQRIVRDSRGFLWFCTTEGLSRFDGYSFTTYGTDVGLPHRFVTDLLETRSGDYWVATGGGVCRFNPAPSADRLGTAAEGSSDRKTSESKFRAYWPGEDEDARFVNVLIEDSAGAIWCGTNGGLYQLTQVNGNWGFRFVDIGLPTKTPDDATVNALMVDRRGALWIGAESGLYRRWPDGRAERFTTRQGLPINAVKALLQDDGGRVWVGTVYGLCRLVPEPDVNRPVVARLLTATDGLPDKWITSLLQSWDGRIWIGTIAGVSELNLTAAGDGPRVRSYTTAQGLSDGEIRTLAEDGAGNLWIGSESGGAMKLASNGFTSYDEASGLGHRRITSVFETRAGELCVTSRAGEVSLIHRFDGQRFTAIRPNVPRQITNGGWGWYQVTLQDHLGEWWVPTGQGLCQFPSVSRVEQLAQVRPKAVYTTGDGLTGENVFRLFEDSRGDLWISTISPGRDSLTRWERRSRTFHRYSEADGIPGAAPTAFCQDRSGNLWVGFYTGGLARYRNGRFRLFTAADGLPAGMILGLYLDHLGRLWMATSQGGLGRIDDLEANPPPFITYTTAEGLAGNDVRCITEDQWGYIYIGTGRGVDRLDPVTGRIKHYTTADGLVNSEVWLAFRDRQGGLWFGTLQGLSRLIPGPDPPQSPPPICIAGLRLAGIPYPLSELGETEVAGIELGPDQNQVQIDFCGLGFAVGEALRYQYKLEDADQDWSPLSDQRTINYANLSPGTYRFLVRAVSADGLTSPTPASVALTLLPPIWQRWWFLALAAIVTGLMAYAIHRYRLARLLELERVRTRIATDLHDDIGASLSRMAILSEVVKREIGFAPQPSVQRLTEIADTARELVDTMSDIVWSIDPRRDDLKNVIARIRQFASDVLEPGGIGWEFHTPPEPEKVKLSPEQRRHIFLIFKEAINNMVRHADCDSVWLGLGVGDGRLVAEIHDNGRGFTGTLPSESERGHGLKNMQARAAELGGRVRIESAPGQGTRLTLIVPLK